MKTLILFIISFSALACEYNSDCQAGSECIKRGYSLYGVCAGGMAPGNENDSNPEYNRDRPKSGNECSFDLDCGIGGNCVKDGYIGVCL
jgi:hypothetical protein